MSGKWRYAGGGNYEYYPDDHPDGDPGFNAYAIDLYFEDDVVGNKVYIWDRSPRYDVRRNATPTDLPPDIKTIAEAKAWAIATWRMG